MQKQGCLARPVHIVRSLEKLISSATSHCSAYPACLKPCLITISTFHSVQRGIIISDKICTLFLCQPCVASLFPLPPELLPNLFLQLYLTWLTALHVNAHFQLTEAAFGASWCFLTTRRIHLLFKFLLSLAALSFYLIYAFFFFSLLVFCHWFTDTVGPKTWSYPFLSELCYLCVACIDVHKQQHL